MRVGSSIDGRAHNARAARVSRARFHPVITLISHYGIRLFIRMKEAAAILGV